MNNQHSQWDTVIGLEVRVQLNTQNKLFSASTATVQRQTAKPTPLTLPGMLPVLNQGVQKAIKPGLSIGANINLKTFCA